jgi:hypothetical protein
MEPEFLRLRPSFLLQRKMIETPVTGHTLESHDLKFSCSESVCSLLLGERRSLINKSFNQFLCSGMMQMAQTMQCGALANPRINCEYVSQRLKIYILQFQILSAMLSLPIPTMPVVAQRVPPHLDRSIERFPSEKAFARKTRW